MGVAPLTPKDSSEEEANDHEDEIEIIDGPYEPSSLPLNAVKPRIRRLEVNSRLNDIFGPSISFLSCRWSSSVYAPSWHLKTGSPHVLTGSHVSSKPPWRSSIWPKISLCLSSLGFRLVRHRSEVSITEITSNAHTHAIQLPGARCFSRQGLLHMFFLYT
jgi:hypothetical protein